MSDELRLMAVHAHPDDESSKGAATMAYYATMGRVRVVTCTGGERGDVLNPKLADRPEIAENLAQVRIEEMSKAAAALGIEHHWLGFVDSGLPEGDPLPPLPEGCFALGDIDEEIAALVDQIREFKPQVLTCYNEAGGYPHPDHIRSHQVAMAAVEKAADPAYGAGQPWQVSKVYYDVTFSAARLGTVHQEMLRRGLESPFADWIAARPERQERRVDARIECSSYFDQRDEALRAHATQIDPDGFFFAIPRDLEKDVWPWEEFELAFSTVGEPDGQESCLFERIDSVKVNA